MLPSNLSNQDEGKALKARLYKKYESGNSQKNVSVSTCFMSHAIYSYVK